MSLEGGLSRLMTSNKKGLPVEGSKLSVGLPALRYEGHSKSMAMSNKSLNNSATAERIKLYRNDDERQNVMKKINE